MKKLLFLLLFITGASSTYAQLTTPDKNESAGTIPSGAIQFETRYTEEFTKESEITKTSFPTLTVKAGIAGYIELRLDAEYNKTKNSSSDTKGLAPIRLGFKISATKETEVLPASALFIRMSIPKFASEELQDDETKPELRLVLTKALSKNFKMHANLGSAWQSGISNEPSGFYGVSGVYGINKKLSVYSEIYGNFSSKIPRNNIDGGIIYLPVDFIQVHIVGGTGISKGANTYYIEGGAVLRLNN